MGTVTTLVVPDTHIPYQNVRALDLLAVVIDIMKPDRAVFLGDWVDNYKVSRYVKDPKREFNLEYEITLAGETFRELTSGVNDVWFCEGNHEIRLPKYIAENAPELASMFPSLRQTWGIPANRWVPYYQHVTLDGVSYTHDVGHGGKHAARTSLDAFGDAIVFGHTHVAAVVHDGDVGGRRRFALNCGWLGDPTHIDYRHRASTRGWATGFGWIVQTIPDGSKARRATVATTTATFVPITLEPSPIAIVEGTVIL